MESQTIGWGYSTAKNPKKAGKTAAQNALNQIYGNKCHSCIVFSTVGYPIDELLKAIELETGSVSMTGCSGEGVIGTRLADESNHCVIVLAIADPRLQLITAGFSDAANSVQAGEEIGGVFRKQLSEESGCILVFPCGLNSVADEFVFELEKSLGKQIPIIGGLAGDNHMRKKTYQYHDWNIYEGGISAALLNGQFELIMDVTHGCVPLGMEMKITKVVGNRVYEIDNRPAEDVMVEYVGEDVKSNFGRVSIHFCIGQETDPELARDYDPFVIRYIARHHPEDKSISLPVKFNEGDRIWMTRRDHDKIFKAVKNSGEKLKSGIGKKQPFLVLHFDCAGRGKIIFSEEDKLSIISELQKGINPEIPWIGFYSYGEFCPVGNRNIFHNFTAVMAVFVWKGPLDG